MGLVAALYYSLWRKKRVKESRGEIQCFSCLFCRKKKQNSVNNSQEQTNSPQNPEESRDGHEQIDLELRSSMDLLVKDDGEQGVETELMRLHNLCGPGPPRFLFTIKEESEEDLESVDGKSKGDNSSRKESRKTTLRDLFISVDGIDTPYLTPSSSTSIRAFDSYYDHGLRSISEAELNRLRCHPPPKLKFLKNADDKLLTEEAENKRGGLDTQNSRILTEEEKNGSMSLISKSCYKESLALPMAASPTSSSSSAK
ncbi:Hypothetical predicted protein [Olea europaea subsp. europaea]|uniref:Uncharacterized protein n=1 Tax=Olea europaea subsp. europaea TaxID=158383 RepID=A0A8S0Q1W1_OLEEU|nr:Hypothetical predicted protein [Olea europaea subsp. europaea]